MICNQWKTKDAKKMLKLVRQGAIRGARFKRLCKSTCQDLAHDFISELLQRPYVRLRDPHAYGWRAGYFKACSFLRKKYAEENYLDEKTQSGASSTLDDALSHTIQQEQHQGLNSFLTTLPLEDLVLFYGSAVLEESVAFIAGLINEASGTKLTTEAFRARLMKLKKRARNSLDMSI